MSFSCCINFLAHLSLKWWAYRIGRLLSSVCVYVVNIFKHLLLRNHWTDWSQISYGASLGLGNEKFVPGPGHMNKMAAMPIYGKTLKKSSFLEPKGRWPWNLVCSIGCSLEYYQVCSNDDPGLTLTYFTARSNLVSYAFVWDKGKTIDFSETIVVYDVKVG